MDVGGDLKLWSLNQEGTFELKASLLFGRNLQETNAIACLGDHLMLLTGGYDSKVHLYTIPRKTSDAKLTFQFSMLGHLNSIKDLAFSPMVGDK